MQNSKSAVKIPPGVPTATTKEKGQINFKFGLNKRKARNFLSQYLKWNGSIFLRQSYCLLTHKSHTQNSKSGQKCKHGDNQPGFH